MKSKFILFDGRAKSGDDSEASVMCTADTEKEAREDAKMFKGYDAIWFEYDFKDNKATNGRPRWDLPPCKL